ncbi:MAG: hypothetical protein ACOH2H_14525 [Cypionkella sp.]
MRAPFVVMMLAVGVAACSPVVPDSGAGAGSQDYNSYIRNSTAPNLPPYGNAAAASPMATTGFSTDSAAAAIDSAQSGNGSAMATGGAPMDPTGQMNYGQAPAVTTYGGQTEGQIIGTTAAVTVPTTDTGAIPDTSAAALPPANDPACAGRGNAFAGIKETTSEMNYASGGVSDEQDFSAVTGRETIASDKQRIECNREQYVVVQPGALPVRPGDTGPNIAAFALASNNPPGVKLYNRPPFYLTSPEKACAKFASPDLAQQAFLAAGGPQRDAKALDPDGDGFACSWDPRPFRKAKQ